ncbi:hypothetical protein BDW02DRAFT_568848 [Decorospora gaudefroyi]|uniref:Uncharacterized protein n=1 Tax=Decorospora gaudefroyi TaxID=184978 RepID=A0A6A5KJP5_9PLEO|nr:hypothetical protein BDW02DRAFT_568848 [Decorospora gaudefroyi]
MPIYRDPTALDVFIDNIITLGEKCLDQLFRDTPLEYWFLHPEGQVASLCAGTLLGTLVWLVVLKYFGWTARARAREECGGATDSSSREDEYAALESFPLIATSCSSTTAPAPAHHLPTNAQLQSSPFRVDHPSAVPQTPPTRGKRNLGSSPGPYAHLALEAPVSFDTLLGNGILEGDGTPTRKWEWRLGMERGCGDEDVGARRDGRAVLEREVDGEGFL